MINFKKANLSDASQINQLVNSAYRGDSSKAGWTTEADILDGQRVDLEKIQEMIELPSSRIELAINDQKELIGCVHLKEEGNCLYLGMLTVNPTLQAKGVGKRMLEHAEMIARELSLIEIRMTVISLREELINFYVRRGYVKTGRTELFPENDPRFGLPKIKGLFFIELIKKLV